MTNQNDPPPPSLKFGANTLITAGLEGMLVP